MESDSSSDTSCFFEDNFGSYFSENKIKENAKNNIVTYYCVWKHLKECAKTVKVKGKILDTVCIADVYIAIKEQYGRDIIIYPSNEVLKWETLRILRADYTQRADKVCAMAWACFTGDINAVSKLISFSSYVDRQMPNGNTLLMEAIAGRSKQRCECIQLLIQAGARINMENNQGHTVLTVAAWFGDMDVLRLLVSGRHVDINHRTKRGSTPLMVAVAQQHNSIVRYLVADCGADLLLEDHGLMTSVCWSQVKSPDLTVYLCLHLGCMHKLETFVMRRVEVLKQLAAKASGECDDVDAIYLTLEESSLLKVIYQLITVLLMLKPSRRMLVTKGVINIFNKPEVWETMLGVNKNDRLTTVFMQILPWFVALGCGMLYQETYILESFISSGGGDRLLDMVEQTLQRSYEKYNRLLIQSMLAPVMAFKQGREWLVSEAFKYKLVLQHCADIDNVLEEGREKTIASFLSLMSEIFEDYKLKKSHKFFDDASLKELCPDPPMPVGEKLNETMAYFEEIKQKAREAQADQDIQALLEQEKEDLLRKGRNMPKARTRKLKRKAERKMRRSKEQVTANKDDENDNKLGSGEVLVPCVEKAKIDCKIVHHPVELNGQVDAYQIIDEGRPLAVRDAEDMYRSNVESPSKKKADKNQINMPKCEKIYLDFSYGDSCRDGEWQTVYKYKQSKSKLNSLRNKRTSDNISHGEVMNNDGKSKKLSTTSTTNLIHNRSRTQSETAIESTKSSVHVREPKTITPPPIPDNCPSYCEVAMMTPSKSKPASPSTSQHHLTAGDLLRSMQELYDPNPYILDPAILFAFKSPKLPIIPKTHSANNISNLNYQTISKFDQSKCILSLSTEKSCLVDSTAAGDGALLTTPKQNIRWIACSKRWHTLFEELCVKPASNRMKIGTILFSFEDEALFIGTGSTGAVVTVGICDDGRELAVKRLPKCTFRIMRNDLETLHMSEVDHPNILHYEHFYREDDVFGYLAMELCEYTLEVYVRHLQQSDMLRDHVHRLSAQIIHGLIALHYANILHMHLTPQNVLVDVHGNARLVDFGLMQHLDGIHLKQTSTFSCGSQCWLSREALQGTWPGVTYKADVQVAGMLIFYVVTGGHHPYEKTGGSTAQNVYLGAPTFTDVTDETLVNLMSWMLHPNVDRRKSAQECLIHPFFWLKSKRFAFLLAVNQVCAFQESPRSSKVREVIDNMGPRLNINDWRGDIDAFIMPLALIYTYYGCNLSDLLRFMADVDKNFNNLGLDMPSLLGDPGDYFLSKFSRVFMIVYEIVRESKLRFHYPLTDFFNIDNNYMKPI